MESCWMKYPSGTLTDPQVRRNNVHLLFNPSRCLLPLLLTLHALNKYFSLHLQTTVYFSTQQATTCKSSCAPFNIIPSPATTLVFQIEDGELTSLLFHLKHICDIKHRHWSSCCLSSWDWFWWCWLDLQMKLLL